MSARAAAAPEISPQDAEEFTQSLGQIVGGAWRQIALAKRLGVPKALGLDTEDWVRQRLGGYVQLAVDERRDAVRELAGEGMSNRGIAEILGVDDRTIRRDAANAAPPVEKPREINGPPGTGAANAAPAEPSPLDAVALLAADEKVEAAARATVIREAARAEVRANLEGVAAQEAKAVLGVYDVIVIDPPWPMQKIERDVAPTQVGFDYPTMDEAELAALKLPMADDCHVWCWTTQKFFPMAWRLLDAWGLRYVCHFVWNKPGGFQPFGLPQYNCELALYARKGTPVFVDTKAFPISFSAPRGAHSEKPAEFYGMVRRVTAGRRLDMFARREIEGFDAWGNEAAEPAIVEGRAL